MSGPVLNGPFDIADMRAWVPRRIKPWLFIVFVLIIQFSGGVYLAAASDMVGSTALMNQDILMAGYAQLAGMSLNFAVMFRIKFRFSNRTVLLGCCIVLLAANYICSHTASVLVLVATCFIAGWFRMQATFACNSTIQLWITPVRDMSIFFCYVYLIVDGVIQLLGVATIYTAVNGVWEDMHLLNAGLLVVMMILVMVFMRPVHAPLHIPLLGIDWLGAILWSGFMLCFTYVCVYGNYYDWWQAREICAATVIGLACLVINLWRATFLRHPYISFMALKNRNVVRAVGIYIVFFTLMSTEHVVEHGYAASILGFDEENMTSLNWYMFCGILAGVIFSYLTFARRRWRYKTMTAIGFSFAALYLAYFYFLIDFGVEKEALFLPIFCRGFGSVVISIVFLTSIVQSGLPFQIFPQALAINGFACAVLGATLGPAVIGELLSHITAKNISLLGSAFTHLESIGRIDELYGLVSVQAYAVSVKEIYGWLLMVCLVALLAIMVSYFPTRPWAIFPKWRTIRRILRREGRAARKAALR